METFQHVSAAGAPTAARLQCRHRGAGPGPTLVVVGGLHGNEPAGLAAARTVVADLAKSNPDFRGEIIVLAGNLRALERQVRYQHRDLNRVWTPERIREIRGTGAVAGGNPEDLEQRELLEEIDRILHDLEGEAYFLDLHTSSAQGCPFLTVGDTLRNRRFAMKFPLPLILGLEEQLEGSLLEYLNNRGMITLGVEAGQHDAPSSVDHFIAAVWIGMVAAGMLREDLAPDIHDHRALLANAAAGMPRVVEVRFRFAIMPADHFRMQPGYANFRKVQKGELLAVDRDGEIKAILDGMVLLPLYQGQGDDGFFLATEFRPFWLKVSWVLRRLGTGALLPLFPGVRRHPDREGVLIVDTRVARWFPLQIFRLAGYRKLRRRGKLLLVTRRKFDLRAPVRYTT